MTDGSPRPDRENDDELAPPFVPGSPPPPTEDTTGGQGTGEPVVESTHAEPTPAEPPVTPAEEPGGTGAPEAGDEDAFPFETGWDETTEGEADEGPAAPAVPEADTTSIDALEAEPAEEPVAPSAPATDDDFPVDSFDIEGEGGVAAPAEPGAGDMAGELADRLEDMARRLRDQGPAAAEAEMSSGDRFTALLGGLLAGYLAARE